MVNCCATMFSGDPKDTSQVIDCFTILLSVSRLLKLLSHFLQDQRGLAQVARVVKKRRDLPTHFGCIRLSERNVNSGASIRPSRLWVTAPLKRISDLKRRLAFH